MITLAVIDGIRRETKGSLRSFLHPHTTSAPPSILPTIPGMSRGSFCRSPSIVTMDGDLQNDPRDIPGMVGRIEGGADVVCGWRKDRKDPFVSRRIPSMTANVIISAVTGVHLHDYGCSLKGFRAEIVKPMN